MFINQLTFSPIIHICKFPCLLHKCLLVGHFPPKVLRSDHHHKQIQECAADIRCTEWPKAFPDVTINLCYNPHQCSVADGALLTCSRRAAKN